MSGHSLPSDLLGGQVVLDAKSLGRIGASSTWTSRPGGFGAPALTHRAVLAAMAAVGIGCQAATDARRCVRARPVAKPARLDAGAVDVRK